MCTSTPFEEVTVGINENLFQTAVNVSLGDIRKGMRVGNNTLRTLLTEQLRGNELAEQQLTATRETNEHLTFLIRGLIASGTIPPR